MQNEVEFNSVEKQRILNNFDLSAAVKDRYTLMAWGLQRKASLTRLSVFLKTVHELKRRFSGLAQMWKEKRTDDDFEDLI